jgi:hypothetical protein
VLSALLILAAASPVEELPEIKFRALSFNEPVIELAIVDAQKLKEKTTAANGNGKDKKDTPDFEPLKVCYDGLTEEKKIHYADGKLTFYKARTNPDGVTTLTTLVEAVVPNPDTPYIAIISGSVDKPTLQLVPDSPEKMAAGSIRFFNVCKARLGIDFPGLRKVLTPGEDLYYEPVVKAYDYGQGQFLLANEKGEWSSAGGMRWIQLPNARTLWFVVPHLNNPNLVVARNITEKVPTAEEIKQAKEKEDEAKKAKGGKLAKTSSSETNKNQLK